MPLLLEGDYAKLAEMGLVYTEDEPNRFLIFRNYPLQQGLYTVSECNVLIVIPQNYNQAGNDMLWTFPRLVRSDGRAIPCTNNPGGSDNRIFEGSEYCRWSRHWNRGQSIWRPGVDDIETIQRRVEWALQHPDAGG